MSQRNKPLPKRRRPPERPQGPHFPEFDNLDRLRPEDIAAINAKLKHTPYRLRRVAHWSQREIDQFMTDDIFRRLQAFNIRTSREEFLADVPKFLSSDALAEERWYSQRFNGEGADEDFPWMAALVLWKRLAPDTPCVEMINDWIDEAYDHTDHDDRPGACQIGRKTWSALKSRFLSGRRSIEEVDELFKPLEYSISGWCQDYCEYLGTSAIGEPDFDRERVQFCREFVELLPESDESLLIDFGANECESLNILGEIPEAEARFAALVAQFPNSPWPLMRWGDMYDGKSPHSKAPADLPRAEELYRKALALADEEDRKVIQGRIESLKEE